MSFWQVDDAASDSKETAWLKVFKSDPDPDPAVGLLSSPGLLCFRGEMTEDEIVQATTLGFTGPIWDGEEEQTHEQVNCQSYHST